MTTFHLLEETFWPIFNQQTHRVVLARREDTKNGDTVRIVSDDSKTAIQCKVIKVTYHEKHNDLMTITISDYEAIDYDICD